MQARWHIILVNMHVKKAFERNDGKVICQVERDPEELCVVAWRINLIQGRALFEKTINHSILPKHYIQKGCSEILDKRTTNYRSHSKMSANSKATQNGSILERQMENYHTRCALGRLNPWKVRWSEKKEHYTISVTAEQQKITGGFP